MIVPNLKRTLVTLLRTSDPRQGGNTKLGLIHEDGRRYLLIDGQTGETLAANMGPRELMKLVWTLGGRDYRLKPRMNPVANSANRTTGGSSPSVGAGTSEWDVHFKNGAAQPWRKSTITAFGTSEQEAILNALDEGFRRAAWTDDFTVGVQAGGLEFDDRQPIDKKRQVGRQDLTTTGQLPLKVVIRRTTGERVKMRRIELGLSQVRLSQLAGLTQPTISALEKNRAHTSGSLASIAQALQVNAFWLETGLGEMEPSIARAPSDLDVIVVPLLPSEGNCGSTCLSVKLDYSPICIRKDLLSKCHVMPIGRLIATYGDGDSMSNFIITGDILVFDTGVRAISDGSVYLIDTPDGPRVKRINRRADGRVVLRNDNQDKGRYPDEEYTAEQARNLSIKGKLVLRIAGS
jgi:phage repressor protein C with HTH and peptisase S24 domain